MALGVSNAEIGLIEGYDEETIKKRMGRILRKLDARNRAQAVATAIRLGLVDITDRYLEHEHAIVRAVNAPYEEVAGLLTPRAIYGSRHSSRVPASRT